MENMFDNLISTSEVNMLSMEVDEDIYTTNSQIVDHEEIVATRTSNRDIIKADENIKVSL